MAFDGGINGIGAGIGAEADAWIRDELPSVVLRDIAGRSRHKTHVITFANEKGGVGKSTLAFHCAVALAHLGTDVLVLDCDWRQQSLHRLLDARDATARTLKVPLPRPKHVLFERQGGAPLFQEIERVGAGCNFVVIDLPGHDSPIARRAIALADTLVTPVNSSPTDLDALGQMSPADRRFRQAGPFASLVMALREERQACSGETFDWIVAKNRIRHCERRLIASVDRTLETLAQVLGFRTIDGLTERVGYREMLPFGLTQFDLRFIPRLGNPRTQVLRELREMIDGLRLPRPDSQRRNSRVSKFDAPVLARTAQRYRAALYAATPVLVETA